jgi:hypothetical protein
VRPSEWSADGRRAVSVDGRDANRNRRTSKPASQFSRLASEHGYQIIANTAKRFSHAQATPHN